MTSPPSRGIVRIPVLLLIVFLLTMVPQGVEFLTDWLWYGEVGYRDVFVRTVTAKITLGAIAFIVAFGLLFANLSVTLRSLRRRNFEILTPDGPRVITVDPGRLRPLVYGGAALVSLFVALFTASQWEQWLLFLYGVPFGSTDPILERDIGFYLFSLPFLQTIQRLAVLLFGLTTAAVVGAYVAAGSVGVDPGGSFFAGRSAIRHVSFLVAALLLALTCGAWLGVYGLLTSSSGTVFGASYADVHARLPALRILMVAGVVAAGIALAQARRSSLLGLGVAFGIYLAVSLAGSGYAALIQRLVVAPNEQTREAPYIIHNVAATRAAFALDEAVERELTGDDVLTRADIDENQATLGNVPLWNHQPLLDTFSQIQEIRTYYDFVSVDNDRYTIDGEYRQIMLSARELNSESLPSRTWINERLTFTHGYGLTLGPVNQVTPEGLPVLFIKDLPPQSSVDLEITRPALYFGELSSDHVYVRTATREFDYPTGEDNVFAVYEGEGGVPISGFLRRLLFALRFRSTDTLFSRSLVDESRVLMHRRISERVGMIAPFLTYDPDPYLAISDGRLIWIQDAYTTSRMYPYSTPAANGLNYIRNSVKVTIDAYDGTTTFHLIDPGDPIAATLARIFPSLFKPLDAMPEDLRSRLRYPQGIFAIQAAVFATFHMTNPDVFYNKEDQWEIPAIDIGGQSALMEPYYTIMKLPEETGAEFIQMLPFTPRQKDNLAAWMVARSDGENYGQLIVFQFPKQKVIFGPRQVVARINQDQAIAPQITLWNQQGSEVIQGTLLVIPIEASLIYIRPLYLRAAGGRIPELKRVVVAYQNQIVMEETLDQALDRIFPPDGRPLPRPTVEQGADEPDFAAPAPVSGVPEGLAAQARQHYDRAIQAQRNGDWATYGEEIRRLGEILQRMQAAPPQ